MDYQDGNGEGLFGARNENSVLFSLDSLTAMENEQSGPSDGAFGPSGDASGLIDLNTLSKLSAGASVEGVGENNVMESMVFNEVSTKEKRRNLYLIIGVIVLLIAAAGVVIFLLIRNSDKEKEDMMAQSQTKLADEQAKQAELEKKLADLEQQNAEQKAELAKRKVSEADIQKALEKEREAAKNAALGIAEQTGENKPKRSGGGGSAAKGDAPAADAAPAPAPKAKIIEKGVLVTALKDATTKAAKCGKGGSLTVSFNIKNGSATNVTAAGGSFAGTATEKCILTVFQKYSWPDGNATGIKYPVKL
ncbi:MAG: hypothetical protein IKY83_05525 [Proteobacteria bacterium]|nr:hypothetical protein [Pseudomonadota bacterium]